MELTYDMVCIQGILMTLEKTTGEFVKISCRGGNEDNIDLIIEKIEEFLLRKNYIKDGKINEEFDKPLEGIVAFLAINTSYKHKYEDRNNDHLINIIPTLSKCLFTNIIFKLDLCKYFCELIKQLPMEICAELIDEMTMCLVKSNAETELKFSQMILKSVACRLQSLDDTCDVGDSTENLVQVAGVMLQNLTSLQSNHISSMNTTEIYLHMGFCLRHLFDLLLSVDLNRKYVKKFTEDVVRYCTYLFIDVTMNVYCTWVEVEEDDSNLQEIIAEQAYQVIAAYSKCTMASQLVSCLSSVAKKPLTISQKIQRANVHVKISKVNSDEINRKSWFKALITSQALKNKEIIKCIEEWSHLCDGEDVTVLLNQCIHMDDLDTKILVVKCATNLNLTELKVVMSQYFHGNGFSHVLSENVELGLLMLNKLNESSKSTTRLVNEISLLLLQNPLRILRGLYRECLRSTYYTDCILETFKYIRDIAGIENIGINILLEVMLQNQLNSQNVPNHAYLLKELLKIEYFSEDSVINKVFIPLLKSYSEQQQLEELNGVLQIILNCVTIPISTQTKDLLEILLQTMATYRCTFSTFIPLNQQITENVVNILFDSCEVNSTPLINDIQLSTETDHFTTFYKRYLLTADDKFYKHYCPDFSTCSYGKCVCQLLKVLPSAVPREWVNITDELVRSFGYKKSLELLTDMMTLLAELLETQDKNQNANMFFAMQYCIKNYGLAIQNKIQNSSKIEAETEVVAQVCRLLGKLPVLVKEEEGPLLVNILSHRALKALSRDQEFLSRLVLIRSTNVCKMIAQKTLE